MGIKRLSGIWGDGLHQFLAVLEETMGASALWWKVEAFIMVDFVPPGSCPCDEALPYLKFDGMWLSVLSNQPARSFVLNNPRDSRVTILWH